MSIKLILTLVLLFILIPTVIVLIRYLLVLPNYIEIELNRANYHQCSWLKVLPKGWQCRDNWNNRQRVVIATNNKQTIEVYIDQSDSPIKQNCIRVFPASIPHRPSASGITIPFWCSDGRIIADWEQDGANFRIIANDIPLELFLINLDTIGWTSQADVQNWQKEVEKQNKFNQ